MSIDNKSDFTLFNMAYIHPETLDPVWVGEMRGWHARKFIKECEWDAEGYKATLDAIEEKI